MSKLVDAVKQYKQVIVLKENNEMLENKLNRLQYDYETLEKKYEITDKQCKRLYTIFRKIKEKTSQNINNGNINLQNQINTILEEVKFKKED